MESLKRLRLEHNLTQNQIAQFLGIDRTTYSKYETEASEPPIATLIKLSHYFNVSVGYIVGSEEYKAPTVGIKMSRLAEVRKREDLTQAQVAEQIGVDRTTYVKYENGVINIPLDSLIKIAKVLNTSIDYIVGITEVDLHDDRLEPQLKKEVKELINDATENQLMDIKKYIRFTFSESSK